MSKGEIICSVLERNPEATRERAARAPARSLVEIRGDHLSADGLASVVAGIGRDAIVTVRRPEDGGSYAGDEANRRGMLEAALAAGARWVDVELGSPLADMAEGAAAGRTILSHHGGACRLDVLRPLVASLGESRAERLKLVPVAERVEDVTAIRTVLAEGGGDRRLACFAMGRAGAISRLLCLGWGGWATYGAPRPSAVTAPGQFTVQDMEDLYDVRTLGPETPLNVLIGSRVFGSPSPAMHNAAYRAGGVAARYLPCELDPADGIERIVALAEALPLSGLAVTVPFKSEAARRCRTLDAIATTAAAVNTVTLNDGWRGANTDGPAAIGCVERAIGEPLAGKCVAVLGAGGTSRAVGAAALESGAQVRYHVRDVGRARASLPDADVREWSALGEEAWDVLVNGTPLGTQDETVVEVDSLTGRVVLDAVYRSTATPLASAARARGLAVVDGFALLVAQAVLQCECHVGLRPDAQLMASTGRDWLAANG